MGHRFSVTIVIFIMEFALKLVLEASIMAKSCLNLCFDFKSQFCCRLNSRAGLVYFVDLRGKKC